jgi:hypothetical protein
MFCPLEEAAVCRDGNIPITFSKWPRANDYNTTSTDRDGALLPSARVHLGEAN